MSVHDARLQTVGADRIWSVADSARGWLDELQEGERVVLSGAAFGARDGDTELRADRVLGERFLQAFSDPEFLADVITIEGMGDHRPHADGRFAAGSGLWYSVDQLDGSLNFRQRHGSLGLPYASCVTVLNGREGTTFGDVLAGCVVDLRNGDRWSVAQGGTTMLNGFACGRSGPEKLDLGSQIVIGEMYYPDNREALARAFAGMRGWLRNPGSAAYEMALVASGTAVAYVCDRQKQHELGAGCVLVTGAGGVAVDWHGNDLASRPFVFNAQTPCVLAVNRAIAEQVLHLLHAS